MTRLLEAAKKEVPTLLFILAFVLLVAVIDHYRYQAFLRDLPRRLEYNRQQREQFERNFGKFNLLSTTNKQERLP